MIGDKMYIEENSKKIPLKSCENYFNRLIGLMGKKEIKYAVVFPKCNSIHTMFMKTNIDVYMCNKENEILYIYKNLPKNKFIMPKKEVYYTYELPVNYFDFKLGQTISITNNKK